MPKTVYSPATRAGVHDDLDAGIEMKVIAKRRRVPYSTVRRWKTEGRPDAPEYQACGPLRADSEHRYDVGPMDVGAARGALNEQSSSVRLSHEQLDEQAAPLARRAALKLLQYLAGEADTVLESVQFPRELLEQLSPELRRALSGAYWNPRDARAAAHALASLVDKVPDILSLHERTRASGEPGVAGERGPAGEDDLVELRRALAGPADGEGS